MNKDEKPQIHIDPTQVFLDIEGGNIIFGSPHGVYHLQPHIAVNVANAILSLVGQLGYEVQVQTEPRHVTDMQRLHMINRALRILQSMSHAKNKQSVICTHIVDSILAQVL